VVAEEEPDIAAKSIDANTATAPNPPRTQPTSTLAKLINLFAIPPVVIIFPARIKKGIAINEKEFRLSNVF